MTAFEMFKTKYEEWIKRITPHEWESLKNHAASQNMTLPDHMMMCIEITVFDANPNKNADVYWELIKLNEEKLVASNRHRQYHGKVDTFWLTKKGLRKFNAIYNS